MLDVESARAIAEEFARLKIPKWEYYGYRMERLANYPAEDGFLFVYGPTRNPDDPNSSLKVGGHAPVLVDARTSQCRYVGVDEYMELKQEGKV